MPRRLIVMPLPRLVRGIVRAIWRRTVTTPDEQDPLVKGVRLRDERARRGQREGDPSVARRLGQIGVLGWIIVTPMLIGVFAGRWRVRTFNSGLFCTAPLLLLGAVLGCWSAWRWMQNA